MHVPFEPVDQQLRSELVDVNPDTLRVIVGRTYRFAYPFSSKARPNPDLKPHPSAMNVGASTAPKLKRRGVQSELLRRASLT